MEDKEIKEVKKLLVAKYIGDYQVSLNGKKINKGDIVPEISVDEAKTRADFEVIEKGAI